jgi:uncharacterized repeat protein (TIGR01451 family)
MFKLHSRNQNNLPECHRTLWRRSILTLLKIGGAVAVVLLVPSVANASITMVTDPLLVSDSNGCSTGAGPRAAYVGFKVTNNTGSTQTNLQATITGFSSGFSLTQNGSQPQTQYIGTLANNASRTVYWHFQYPCHTNKNTAPPAPSNTFTVTVNNANTSALIDSATGTVTSNSSISANAGGLISSATLGDGAVLGQIITYDVKYIFGSIKSGDRFNLQPAGNINFRSDCLQLLTSKVTNSDIGAIPINTLDQLFYQSTVDQNGTGYTATIRYSFLYQCNGVSSSASPYSSQTSGNDLKYSGNFGAAATTITFPAATNSFSITKTATPNSLTDGGTVTYTITIKNNSTTFDARIDRITDVLPNGVTFGSTITGLTGTVSAPSNGDTGTIKWLSQSPNFFKIQAGQSVQWVYTATIPDIDGTYTNSAKTGFGLGETSPATTNVIVAPPVYFDYGDAPDTYGTNSTNNNGEGVGANHVIVNTLKLGATAPDSETDAQTPLDGTGDGADEDGISIFPSLNTSTASYSLTATVNNTTGSAANVYSWIDFDHDGKFDGDERATVSNGSITLDSNGKVPTGSNGTVTLTWNNIGSTGANITDGNSYVRIRLTTDNLSAATASTTRDPASVGNATNGEVEDYKLAIAQPHDYGDAPNSYGDAGHEILATPTIYLGSTKPDQELGTQLGSDSGAAAAGDDNNGTPDDEDAFTTLANVSTIDNYDILVPLRNTSGGNATLHAWLDLDKDGKFEAGEYQNATVANTNNSKSASLNWQIPSGTTSGDTYIRFRLTTATLTDTAGTTNLDERSIGNVTNGEVEDYKVAIEPVPSLPASSVGSCEVAITNGSFESPALSTTPPTPYQTFVANKIAAYNENDVPGWTSFADSYIELWRNGNNTSGNPPAYEGEQFAEINAYVNGSLYQDVYTIPGSVITWQFAHRGRAGVDTMNLKIGSPGATVAQINPTNNTTSFQTGNTAWVVYQGTYTVPPGQTTTRFEYKAVSTASGSQSVGNFIDAVRFGPLCDHGDAKSDYPVLRNNNGAAHVNDGVTFLGSKVRIELDGQPSATANGDDGIVGDVDQIDDEDGVTFPSTLNTGRTASVDIVASVPGYLNAWIDFNQDNDWDDSGEKVFTDRSLNAGTNNLSLAIPANANIGNTFARFRFSTNGGINPTGIVAGGEVEDYQIAIAQPVASDPKLLLVKRITAINPGQPDAIQFNNFVNDGSPTDDEAPNWPDSDGNPSNNNNNINTYLRGATSVDKIKPGDEVEYTIYFLSNGDAEAKNIKICDVVPDNMTFVANSYRTNFGMALALNATALPPTTKNLSNAIGDNDEGDYYPPNTNPSTNPSVVNPCKKRDPNNPNTLILVDGSNNLSGAVLIKLNTPLPKATGSGTPPNSYGFIRFRAKVK